MFVYSFHFLPLFISQKFVIMMFLHSLIAECPIYSLRIQLLCNSFSKPCVRQGNILLSLHFCMDTFLEVSWEGIPFLLSLQEEPETRLAIQEALSMMVGAYSTLEGAQRTLMEALVASYLIKVGPSYVSGNGQYYIHFALNFLKFISIDCTYLRSTIFQYVCIIIYYSNQDKLKVPFLAFFFFFWDTGTYFFVSNSFGTCRPTFLYPYLVTTVPLSNSEITFFGKVSQKASIGV